MDINIIYLTLQQTPLRMTTSNHLHKSSSRQSNIELLRIVAMFLVLVVHADFWSLGIPKAADAQLAPASTACRYLFEAMAIGCVNLFVMISGYFGIRPKVRSLSAFIFQCLFFSLAIYGVMLLAGWTTPHSGDTLRLFYLTKDHWFIKSYLLLYIIAPVLNTFVEHATRAVHRNVVIGALAFQSLFGWYFYGAADLMGGYSTMSFIILYLLAQYLRRYSTRFTQLRPSHYLIIIIVCIAGMTLTSFFCHDAVKYVNSYTSPIVIALCASTLLLFSKLRIQSRLINWVAASSFAVYLLHLHFSIAIPYFRTTVRHIYATHDGVICLLLIFLFLLGVYVCAIVIDQVRIALWRLPLTPTWKGNFRSASNRSFHRNGT